MYQQNLTYQSGHPTYERASTSNASLAPSAPLAPLAPLAPSAPSAPSVNEVDLVPSYQQAVLTSGKF